MKLERRFVEKPWGRNDLPALIAAPPGKKIGEVWFTADRDLPLLAKYIFTSEGLSIQVHPPQKTECWYVLDAEPDATIGLGLTRAVSGDELRAVALDGSIEQLVDWRPVTAGDFFLVPPGTIHAIGGGLALLEFQQNADITYRLYDYGRRRELHVDDAVAVADPAPYPLSLAQHVRPDEQRILVDGPRFRLARTGEDAFSGQQRWVLPLDGEIGSGPDRAGPGECLLLEPSDRLASDRALMLIGAMP